MKSLYSFQVYNDKRSKTIIFQINFRQIFTILAPCNSHVTNLHIENKAETSHLYVLHLSNAKKIIKTNEKNKIFLQFWRAILIT